MKSKIWLLILILFTSPVLSDELGIVIGGLSKHYGDQSYIRIGNDYDGWDKHYCDYWIGRECHDYNEVNPTLGIEYENFTIAVSKLSYYNWGVTTYYTYEPDFTKFQYVEFGIRVGGIYGYDDTPVNMVIAPLFAPVMEIMPCDKLSIEFGVMPTGRITVVTANIKYRIGI